MFGSKVINKIIPNYTSLALSNKTTIRFILIFTTIVIFDSTVVKFSSYSGVEASVQLNVVIFLGFCLVFAASSTALVLSVIKNESKKIYTPGPATIRYLHGIIVGTQMTTIAISSLIVFQIFVLSKYSLILLRLQIYISHLSATVFLACLIIMFMGWIASSKRNYGVVLYAVSFTLVLVNQIVSLAYLDSYLSTTSLPDVKPYPIISYVTNLSGITAYAETLSIIFDAIALTSFLVMWIATVIFLSQYKRRIGKIKFFSLLAVPLIYYIFPLQGYVEDVFFSVLQTSPISYSIIYILIFSATKQVGAVLFSLVFWTTSSIVSDERVRRSLFISSIGMAILFGTFEISPVQYHVYPPYGFITQAFIPLGTYLLFIGIFSSARVVSRDALLRKEFYNSAASQLSLLKSIGVSQMEKELEKQVRYIYKRSGVSDTDEDMDEEQSFLDEQNAREILHDVLNELYQSRGKEKDTRGI